MRNSLILADDPLQLQPTDEKDAWLKGEWRIEVFTGVDVVRDLKISARVSPSRIVSALFLSEWLASISSNPPTSRVHDLFPTF